MTTAAAAAAQTHTNECVFVEVSQSVSVSTSCPLIKESHLVRPRHVSEPYEEGVYFMCGGGEIDRPEPHRHG